MKLRTIEISGFKSFADNTKIEFKDGITGIVGPNGSGKSNIIEAIRWVMGKPLLKVYVVARCLTSFFRYRKTQTPFKSIRNNYI
ncbi:AAA family ATPase [Pediococcus pentosaceus]